MTWANFAWFAVLLICPLAMVFMMRGMHGGAAPSRDVPPAAAVDPLKDRRLAALEQEVADLRAANKEQRYVESRKQ